MASMPIIQVIPSIGKRIITAFNKFLGVYVHTAISYKFINKKYTYFTVSLLEVAFVLILDFFLVISTLRVIAKNTQLICGDRNHKII